MAHVRIGQVIAMQAEGLAGTAEHGVQGAAGQSTVGASSVGVSSASTTGAVFLSIPADVQVRFSGDASKADLAIVSASDQTMLAANRTLSIESADGQPAVIVSFGEHPDQAMPDWAMPDWAVMDALQPDFHEMRHPDWKDRFMAKLPEHGDDWSWMG